VPVPDGATPLRTTRNLAAQKRGRPRKVAERKSKVRWFEH
jgi:hypothetical protein